MSNTSYGTLINEVEKLYEETQELSGTVRDADTVLVDLIQKNAQAPELEEYSAYKDLKDIYDKAADKQTFLKMFFFFTNTDFEEYLVKAKEAMQESISRKNDGSIPKDAVQILVDFASSGDARIPKDVQEVIDRYFPEKYVPGEELQRLAEHYDISFPSEQETCKLYYRQDSFATLSIEEARKLVEYAFSRKKEPTEEIYDILRNRFESGYIPGCELEELAQEYHFPMPEDHGARDIEV